MTLEYWYTHRAQMIFSSIFLFLLLIVSVLYYIPNINSEEFYEGKVISSYLDSDSNLLPEDYILGVNVDENIIKYVRGAHYHLDTTLKIRCTKTFLFGAESCHIVVR